VKILQLPVASKSLVNQCCHSGRKQQGVQYRSRDMILRECSNPGVEKGLQNLATLKEVAAEYKDRGTAKKLFRPREPVRRLVKKKKIIFSAGTKNWENPLS